jgi:hypothetical protein
MKKFIAVFLVFITFISLLSLPKQTRADDNKQGIVFVGDSRTVGMKSAIGDIANQFTWICEVGKSGSWVKEDAQWKILNDMSNKGNITVVYLMGVNNLDSSYESGVANDIATLGFKEVYYVETLGVDPSKYNGKYSAELTNDKVTKFNSEIASATDKKYKILSMYADISSSNTTDGIHYDPATYSKVFKLITQQLGITSSSGASAEFKEALKNALGREPSEYELHEYSLVIGVLKADGFTDLAITAILGNIICESGGKAFAIEGYGGIKTVDGKYYKDFEVGNTYDYGESKPPLYKDYIGGIGHGLVQWSTLGRTTAFRNFGKAHSSEFSHITVTHWLQNKKWSDINPLTNKPYSEMQKETCVILDFAGQTAFILEEMHGSFSKVKTHVNEKTTVFDASTVILVEYETPDGHDTPEKQTQRAGVCEKFVPVVEAYSGVIGSTQGINGVDGNNSDVQAVAQYMQLRGYWTEQQISSFTKLNETNIANILSAVSKDNLTGDQLDSLNTWEDIINDDAKQGGVLYWIRLIVMWLGILMVVWSVLLYVGFWFDRANNFLDFSIVTILTLGKLTTSVTDEESTFGKKDVKGIKTLSSRQVTIICLCCIGAGVLIISGIFYRLIAGLVNWVQLLIS